MPEKSTKELAFSPRYTVTWRLSKVELAHWSSRQQLDFIPRVQATTRPRK